jgi:oligopeptide transport system substrate-binding protein
MPYFHSIMALWVVYPAKEENIQAGGETWWQSPQYQIGNGAWILEDFNQNTGSVYSSNPNYYSGEPNYDIQIKYIEDSVVAFEAYKNNELDVIASASETLSEIENDPDLTSQHLTYAGSCTFGIKFNLHPTRLGVENPFSDKKVREAFALAFDTESWIREVDSGLSFAASTWIPPGFPGYDSTASPTFDVEAARAALAESSYGGPDALNALGLKLTFGDSARNRQRFEWLVANYKSNLGIDLALDPVESTTFSGMLRNSDQYPLLNRAGWCVDIPDPQDWLSSWRSGSSLTRPQGYNNPNFDALLDAADTELDPTQRAELYRQAQQTMISDIPMALAYHTLQHFLVKPWVKGIRTTPKDLMFPGDINATSISIDVASIP